MANFVAIQPVLPAINVSKAIDFYVCKMGFELAFRDSKVDPQYAGVKRDSIEIHFQRHDQESFEKVERLQIRFVIDNVDKLFKEYNKQNFLGMNDAPIKTVWGTYEFSFYDLNKNALSFYQDL